MSAVLDSKAQVSTPAAQVQRLRLKNHVFFRPTPKGVLFDAGKQSFVLQGKGVYSFVERVIALMDAGHSLEQIERNLPVKLFALYQQLMQALLSHGMLIDDSADALLLEAAGEPDALREFIKYLQDKLPPSLYRPALQRWRESSVLLVGDGYALKAAAKALANSGVGQLQVMVSEEKGRVSAAEIRASLAASGVRGQRHSVRHGLPAAADLQAQALLLLASDADDGEAQALYCDALAGTAGTPCLIGARLAGQAFVLPLAEPGQPGLQDLLQWLPPNAAEAHSPASLALMGSVAAQHALRYVFNIELDGLRRQAHRINPYLELSQHPILAAPLLQRREPLARDAQHFISQLQAPADRPLSRYEALRVDLAPWFDAVTGVLRAPSGRPVGQLPLYHDAIELRFPRLAQRPSELLLGWGLNAEQAGMRALAGALTRQAQIGQSASVAARTCCAFDEQDWQRQALALALVQSADFVEQRHCAWLDCASSGDGTLQLLQRLLKFLRPEPARFLLHWHPGAAACLAECFLGDELIASAVACTPLLAMQEAMGRACSDAQLKEWAPPRPAANALPPAMPAQWQTPPARLDARIDGGPAASFTLRSDLALPAGVFCGHATLDIGSRA
ncbi:hypothetical protein RQP53_11290 [Paucibacter sp. APW11]|uniref:Thiazole-containing bacteriocin maturation protein n=1 Tax=Roseateles aquae TaxID=3077235 RepID=A0ABU3PBF3_9BURK|nr:hypothetical protein [Paucibacter sp. APW11]MDT8999853.1 hypothetical protein [Paucibacter sp. APW11]